MATTISSSQAAAINKTISQINAAAKSLGIKSSITSSVTPTSTSSSSSSGSTSKSTSSSSYVDPAFTQAFNSLTPTQQAAYKLANPNVNYAGTTSTATANPNAAQIANLSSQLATAQNTLSAAQKAGYSGNEQIQYNSSGVIIPKASVPNNVTDINQMGYPTMPEPNYFTGNYTNAASGVAGSNQALANSEKAYQDYLVQRAEQIKSESNKATSVWDKLSKSLDIAGTRKEAYQDMGFDVDQYANDKKTKIAEIESLDQKYIQMQAAKEQQIAGVQDKQASNSFLNSQIARIERNAAPQLTAISANINAKAAALKALEGSYADARQYANDAVTDVTEQYRTNVENFKTFYTMYKDNFDAIDKTYTTAFENRIKFEESKLADAKETAKTIMDWQISNPKVNLDPTKSLEYNLDLLKASPMGIAMEWSEPYQLVPGGDFVQKNTKTNEIRTAGQVNAGSTSGFSSQSVENYAQGYLDGTYEVTNIPEKYRDQAIARANQLAKEAIAAQQTPTTVNSNINNSSGSIGTGLRNTLGSVFFPDQIAAEKAAVAAGYKPSNSGSFSNTSTKAINSFFGNLFGN